MTGEYSDDRPTAAGDERPSSPRSRASSVRTDPIRGLSRSALIGLFIYATIFVLAQAKSFLVPLVMAFLLAMVCGPIRRFLGRCGLGPTLSSFLIVLTLITAFMGVAGALAVPVSDWVDNAPRIELQIKHRIADLSESLDGVFQANKQIKQMTEHDDGSQVQKVDVQSNSMASALMMLAPSMVAQCIFTLVLLLFLLASGDMFYEKLVHVMPNFRDKRRAIRIAYSIERKLSRYLFTITIINAGLGVSVGLVMWGFGMPDPIVFAIAAFMFNFVPYLGALAGILVSAVVALLAFDWMGWAPIIAGVYLVLTTLEGQMITPHFVGRRLRLNTVVVFIAVSFWAWLWSAVGMIVAVPLLVAIKTFCEHIDGLGHLGDFLSERHAEARDT